MKWSDVGEWIKANAGPGAALIGSLLTGNIPGAVAAGISLVGSATGSTDPAEALQALQGNADAVIRLKELSFREADSIRAHIQSMEEARLKDEQEAHRQQQETIRSGDNAQDEYVRQTRPMMARQSWYAAAGYIIGFEALKALDLINTGAVMELALILLGPAGAYLGFRSFDKWKGGVKP
jgi:hypothetical protein